MKMAASLGYSTAEHDIAIMLEKGIGCEGNLEEAIKFYRLSADKGYVFSENTLGSMYELGNEQIQVDYSQALNFYRKAAEHGLELGRKNLERLLDQLDEEDK